MKAIILNLPEKIDIEISDIKFLLAANLYEQSKLSLDQTDDLVNISKRSFIELLGNYGVSLFNYDIADLKKDYENA